MHGHNGANGAAKPANGGKGIRKRWRHSRSILKEGLMAALRADPDVLEKCKPKTGFGALVRGLVLEAAKSKATPLKQVMSLMDWEGEDEEYEDGIDDDRRDWSEDGVWTTMPPEEPAPADDPMDGPAKRELKRRLTRLVEAGEHEHAARIIDAIRSGNYGDTATISNGVEGRKKGRLSAEDAVVAQRTQGKNKNCHGPPESGPPSLCSAD